MSVPTDRPTPDGPPWIDRIVAAGLDARFGESLGPRTTYRVGGPVAALIEVRSAEDVIAVGEIRADSPMPVAVMGNGSNLLVADAGFDGVVLVMGDGVADVGVEGDLVTAEGGALLPVVARRTVALGLTGFEWAVGVPGSIGGAVAMNAGGHGSDMSESIVEVRVVDLDTGQDVMMTASDLDLSYRSSAIGPHQVVVSATLRLRSGDPEGARRLKDIVAWRRDHQPGGANAGSVFTNPPGDSAGRLIETAGLKGWSIGGATVSDKHANFIQVRPGATATDVLDLMTRVRSEVKRVHGVDLVAETRTLGVDASVRRSAGVST